MNSINKYLLYTFFTIDLIVLTVKESASQRLVIKHSVDVTACRQIADALKNDKMCRPYDAAIDRNNPKMCAPEDVNYVTLNGSPILVFQEIAINQYGYTYVYRSPNVTGERSIIYLQRFNGDRLPRTIETWRVSSSELEKVLSLPPGPMNHNSQRNRKAYPSRDTNADEFASILNRGEKLTDEWSPIIVLNDSHYLLERKCSGNWEYGAYFFCEGKMALSARKITSDGKSVRYCLFIRN